MKRPFAMPLAEAHTPEWYRLRRTMVTASVSSSLMLPDLPWSKGRKELAEAIKHNVWVPNEKAAAGSCFETATAEWLSRITGLVSEPDGWLYAKAIAPRYMGASPDCWLHPSTGGSRPPFEPTLLVYDEWGSSHAGYDAVALLEELVAESRLLVELKQTESRNRSKRNKADPPDYYWNQVQHQMHVLGLTRGLLMTKVDAYEMYGHVITYAPTHCKELDRMCRELWEEFLNE